MTPNFNVQDVVALSVTSNVSLQGQALELVVVDGAQARHTFTPTAQSSALVVNGVTLAQAFFWCQYQTQATDFPPSAAGNCQGQLWVGGVASTIFPFVLGERL